MKKTLSLIALIFITVTVTFAGEKTTTDLKETNLKMATIMDNYCQDLQAAKNARDFARAIDRYTEEMVKIAPVLRAIESEYESKRKDDVAGMKLYRGYQRDMEMVLADERIEKIKQARPEYRNDPRVKKAYERLNIAMEKALGYGQ